MRNRTVIETLSFPPIPSRWGQEEHRFAMGLRDLFDSIRWQRAWPVVSVALSTKTDGNTPVKPFSFGKWEQISTGITGVYGWKRVE